MDARTLRRTLREALSVLYPSAIDASRVTSDVGLPRAYIDFSGSASSVWFSVIEEASKRNMLPALVDFALEEYPESVALRSLRNAVLGEGGREAIASPTRGASAVDAVDLLNRLQRLLPAQFEEVLFRLNAPTAALSSPNAPLSTRAIELIRIQQQNDDLARLQTTLDAVQKRG